MEEGRYLARAANTGISGLVDPYGRVLQKSPMFQSAVLTEEEVRAIMVLAAAAFVVLPLLPNEPRGPFGALNPYSIWRLVVLVVAAHGSWLARAIGSWRPAGQHDQAARQDQTSVGHWLGNTWPVTPSSR